MESRISALFLSIDGAVAIAGTFAITKKRAKKRGAMPLLV